MASAGGQRLDLGMEVMQPAKSRVQSSNTACSMVISERDKMYLMQTF